MIIGISGRMGSGKDTIGEIIQGLSITNGGREFEVKKFAGKLKTIASLLTGIPVENFEEQNFKKLNMGPDWDMTHREFLQKLGTEAMRDGLHTNVWVNALFADYKMSYRQHPEIDYVDHKAYPNWIITDMRFPNEMKAVVERKGITIRVTRLFQTDIIDGNKVSWIPVPGVDYVPHASETAIDDAEFDYEIINDAGIPELIEKVRQILITEKIIWR